MLTESPGLTRLVTSLRVAALVAILGSVVLAAEQRNSTETLPGPTVADQTASASQSKPAGGAQQAAAGYLPAHFRTASGDGADLPPTF